MKAKRIVGIVLCQLLGDFVLILGLGAGTGLDLRIIENLIGMGLVILVAGIIGIGGSILVWKRTKS